MTEWDRRTGVKGNYSHTVSHTLAAQTIKL